jgi:hypothetical protein
LDAEITNLLKAWSAGDQVAFDQLSNRVYDELRLMARRHMKNERPSVKVTPVRPLRWSTKFASACSM